MRTTGSRTKSESPSPDKGHFTSLNAFSERVKGSQRSGQEVGREQKVWGGFLPASHLGPSVER